MSHIHRDGYPIIERSPGWYHATVKKCLCTRCERVRTRTRPVVWNLSATTERSPVRPREGIYVIGPTMLIQTLLLCMFLLPHSWTRNLLPVSNKAPTSKISLFWWNLAVIIHRFFFFLVCFVFLSPPQPSGQVTDDTICSPPLTLKTKGTESSLTVILITPWFHSFDFLACSSWGFCFS